MQTGILVSRFTTGTCAKSTKFRCGSPRLVFIPRRQKTIFGFPSLARYSAAFSDFLQRDPVAALEQDRKLILSSHALEQFEILTVAGADLEHDACFVACFAQRFTDFIDMILVRDLHRDHLDAVLAGQRENVRQAFFAVALKRIGIGSRLVRAHPRANLTVLAKRPQHQFDMLRRIHGAETGKHVEIVLPEPDAVVFERRRPVVVLVPPQDPVALRNPHDAFHARQGLHLVDGQARRIADEINLGQRLLGAVNVMNPALNIGQVAHRAHQALILSAFRYPHSAPELESFRFLILIRVILIAIAPKFKGGPVYDTPPAFAPVRILQLP